MKKTSGHFWKLFLLYISLIWVVSCISPLKQTPDTQKATSADEFEHRKNDFGDGYIAHISIKDVKHESHEEIVRILVTQWLEHYKTNSTAADTTIKDYKLDDIVLMERKNDSDPAIVTEVKFSIIPTQIPNPWASMPGEEIRLEDSWWHLQLFFGVYGDYQGSEYYWLKIMVGG